MHAEGDGGNTLGRDSIYRNSLFRLLEKHNALQLPLSIFFSATFLPEYSGI